MKKCNISKKIVLFTTILTISLNSLVLFPIETFAKEEYRLELFGQLADKITSLYFKEAIVGLDVVEDIYGDELLLKNIEKELEADKETEKYLLERGFDLEKIGELLEFINQTFPSLEQIAEDGETGNVIEKMIRTTLITEDGTLSYMEYDEDIKTFGSEFYQMMPKGVQSQFEQYFESPEEKRDAMIKIVVEYIYSGHGRGIYNQSTKEYVDLKLAVDDNFIKNVNTIFGLELMNGQNKKAINLFLKALEKTVKEKDLDHVYSDISSVLGIVETNHLKENRESNIELEFEKAEKESGVENMEEKQLNRAEILKLALDVLDIELETYGGEFKDIGKDDFYANYISTGENIGLINGYKDSTFRPEKKVTRSEMMIILENTIDYISGDSELTEMEIEELLKDFKYKSDIRPWSRKSTAKLVKAGLIERDYSEKFAIDEAITRDEVMNILDKMEISKKSKRYML